MQTRFVVYVVLLTTIILWLGACTSSSVAPGITPTPNLTSPVDAWTQVRSTLPTEIPVYQPTWLPERFEGATLLVNIQPQSSNGPAYQVSYRNTEGEVIHFVLGEAVGAAGNTARPETHEPIRVHGNEGELFTSTGSPNIWGVWKEGERVYQVLAYGEKINRDEFLQILGSLGLVSALPNGNNNPLTSSPKTSLGGFPFPVGTTWVYSRVEYQQVIGDPTQIITATRLFTETVTRIEGSAPPLSFLEERTVSPINAPPNSNDWMLLNPGIYPYLIQDNQIFEIPSANLKEKILLYDFPLETNKRWCIQPLQPANASGCNEMGWREVQRRSGYATPVGQFDECYQILDLYYTGGTEWFCKDIGVVARKYDHAGTRFGFEDTLIRFAMGSPSP